MPRAFNIVSSTARRLPGSQLVRRFLTASGSTSTMLNTSAPSRVLPSFIEWRIGKNPAMAHKSLKKLRFFPSNRAATHSAGVLKLVSSHPGCFLEKGCEPSLGARCLSTTRPSVPETGIPSGPQEALIARRCRENSFMMEHSLGQTSLQAPTLRVVEIDVDAMDEQRRKIMKRNKFFGVSLVGCAAPLLQKTARQCMTIALTL